MASLVLQRCLNHGGREAVARCPSCGQFYCRECITEHEERVLCAACLVRFARDRPARPRRVLLAAVRPWLAAGAGLLMAWFTFYALGRGLLMIPSATHAGSALLRSFLPPSSDDE